MSHCDCPRKKLRERSAINSGRSLRCPLRGSHAGAVEPAEYLSEFNPTTHPFPGDDLSRFALQWRVATVIYASFPGKSG